MRALVLLLAFAACRSAGPEPADSGRLQVAVSVPPQAYFVEKIGGDHVRVEVMIPPGYSHVDYPLTPRKMAALTRAELYVKVGHPAFDYERKYIDPVLEGSPGIRVVDMSRGMRLIEAGDGAEGHGYEDGHGHGPDPMGGDPHVWVAPETVAVAARNIALALEEADPAHAAEYRANLRRFLDEIAALDRRIRARLGGRGGKFMVYHPDWAYFARQYGLEQIAIEAEGKEPSAQRLIRLIDRARRENVKVVFVQGGFPRKSAQVIADAVGGRVVAADPQNRDWANNLLRVAEAFGEAFSNG